MQVLVEATLEGQSYSTFLQNAETVRLIIRDDPTQPSLPIAVTELKVGDNILMYRLEGARHTGIAIQENILERWLEALALLTRLCPAWCYKEIATQETLHVQLQKGSAIINQFWLEVSEAKMPFHNVLHVDGFLLLRRGTIGLFLSLCNIIDFQTAWSLTTLRWWADCIQQNCIKIALLQFVHQLLILVCKCLF